MLATPDTSHLSGRPQAFIVDLDGTMVDTLGDFVAVLALVLTELKLPVVDRAFVERTVGRGSEHLIRCTLAEVGGDATLYEQAWQRYQFHYAAENGRHSATYPGVMEGLQALRALAGETVSIEVLDVDADPALVEQYDELVPVLVGHRPGQPPVQLCHYHLDEAAVRGFLGRLVADSGLSTPESGKMRS